MRRWLKRITPKRATLEQHWCFRPFTALVAHREYWGLSRGSVFPALWLRLVISFIPPTPFIPVHVVMCAVAGLLLRLNLPVLFATVVVSNTFTWLPQVARSML